MPEFVVASAPQITAVAASAGSTTNVDVSRGTAEVVVGQQRGLPGSRGPAGESVIVYASTGDLAVRAGKGRYRFPFPATLLGVSAAIDTAPAGSPVIVDVNRNGVSVFADPADRLSITTDTHDAAELALATAITVGDVITIDIDAVGSSIPGADLSVFVRYQRS